MTTNPNGANQYTLDPRQKLCWESYINPKSDTFGNALQSALKAGYERGTSEQITVTTWFLEKLRRLNMLGKAEKVLDKTLTYDTEDEEGKIKTDLLRIQTDVAKHITSTLGKHEGYTTKTETVSSTADSLVEVSDEELEIAKQILEHRKRKPGSSEVNGTLSQPMGGEIQDKE